MTTPITCSWCKTVNDPATRWCKTCCHSALHPREECDCRACLGVLFVEEPPPTWSPATRSATKTRAKKPTTTKRRTKK
jgi:hypothetical protein